MSHTRQWLALLVSLGLFVPGFASAASELHVTAKGDLSATGLTVMLKSGSTLYVRATWEDSFMRMVVTTNSNTVVSKNYGEKATVSDIEVGHRIDVEGQLVSGSDTVTIVAAKIRDAALVKESKTFSGTIKRVDGSSQSFVFTDKSLGDVTVVVLPSTPITQGKRQVQFSTLKAGDKVISMSGTYDYTAKTLSPAAIELYQSKDIFVAKNFEGTLKSVSRTTLPAQLTVSVSGIDYTVYLSEKSTVLSKNRSATSFRRFAEGDKVRFYGAIREANLSEVDAEVVRDLNF
ncbi:MAG: hypothetical protein Athens041674_785 [Parcubacteria group bacterium Athens0416_74]|nr:MAG: hypothetical protein Athens041674_785 [Parcubacteria group bacterium Athens0416_74]